MAVLKQPSLEPKLQALELASKLAKPFEGLSLTAYHDPVGYPTQGYGRLLSRTPWQDLSQWPAITELQAEHWLQQDMQTAFRAVLQLCPGAETAPQQAALVDFTFNCGAGNLQASTLRRKVNRQDYAGAAEEFHKWVYARGVKLPGLVRRRHAESQLFLTS